MGEHNLPTSWNGVIFPPTVQRLRLHSTSLFAYNEIVYNCHKLVHLLNLTELEIKGNYSDPNVWRYVPFPKSLQKFTLTGATFNHVINYLDMLNVLDLRNSKVRWTDMKFPHICLESLYLP